VDLVDQLWDLYDKEEYYGENKLSKEEADKHHKAMLESGRIITVSDGNLLVGYVEFFIEHGCCFINDLFIRTAYRRTRVIWMLKRRLFDICGKGKVYFGERNKFHKRYAEVQLRKNEV